MCTFLSLGHHRVMTKLESQCSVAEEQQSFVVDPLNFVVLTLIVISVSHWC